MRALSVLVPVLLSACGSPGPLPDVDALREEVFRTERAFARTMADRDFDAFASFLSEEAVFYSGDSPLEGKSRVVAAWKQYYDGAEAPFSWEPRNVVVLESGTLALSTGPVFDPDGTQLATFTSIWRREGPGTWRIVFDRGCATCAQ